jgi:hypothetical protein
MYQQFFRKQLPCPAKTMIPISGQAAMKEYVSGKASQIIVRFIG